MTTYYGLARVRADRDGRLTPLSYGVGDALSFEEAAVSGDEYTIAICALAARSREEAIASFKSDLHGFQPLLKIAAPDADLGAKEEDEPFVATGKHCDDYIHDLSAPRCLRFFLLVQRLPASDHVLCREAGLRPRLFATTHEGTRVRVVMASRLGDVGITRQLDAEDGYERRVWVADLTNFGETP